MISGQTLIQLRGLVLSVALDVLTEPLVELVMRIEQERHDKMQQRPELHRSAHEDHQACLRHTVLNRGAGQQ